MKTSLTISLACTLLGTGFLAGTPRAHAALLAYEGFDYAAGNVNAKNGGTGWSAAWASSTSAAYASVETATNLDYSGGLVNVSGSGSALSITAGLNDGTLNRSFVGTDTGNEIYISFLFQAVAGSGNEFFHFYLSDVATRFDSGGIGDFQTAANDSRFGARIAGPSDAATFSSPSSMSYTLGTTYFLVGRLSTEGTGGATSDILDRVELWVNPVSLSLGTADATVNANMGLTIEDLVSFSSRFVNFADTDEILIDEIRIGTDVASVVPVPEPSIGGLLILGGLPLLMLRRKEALRRKAAQ